MEEDNENLKYVQEDEKNDIPKVIKNKEIELVSIKIIQLIFYCVVANFCCNSLSMIVFSKCLGSTQPHALFGFLFVNTRILILNFLVMGPINVIISGIHISIFSNIYSKSICEDKKKLMKITTITIIIISIIGFGINEFLVRKIMETWYIVHYYYYIFFVINALTTIRSSVNKAYMEGEKQK